MQQMLRNRKRSLKNPQAKEPVDAAKVEYTKMQIEALQIDIDMWVRGKVSGFKVVD